MSPLLKNKLLKKYWVEFPGKLLFYKQISCKFQFRKNIDRKLKINFSNGDGTQTITGTLIDANDTCVYIRDSGQDFNVGYHQINSAKVLISFN